MQATGHTARSTQKANRTNQRVNRRTAPPNRPPVPRALMSKGGSGRGSLSSLSSRSYLSIVAKYFSSNIESVPTPVALSPSDYLGVNSTEGPSL